MAQTSTASCPHCRGPVASNPRLAGQAVKCPHCQTAFQMPAPTAILVRWFVARDRQKQGPFNHAELQQMAASGQMHPADMLLEEGQQKWRPAREIEGLFPAAVPVDAAGDSGRKRGEPRGPSRRHFSLVWVVVPAVVGASVGLSGGIGTALYMQGTVMQTAAAVVLTTGLFGIFGGLLGGLARLFLRATERRPRIRLAGLAAAAVVCLVVTSLVFQFARSARQRDRNMRPSEEEALTTLRHSLEVWQAGGSTDELKNGIPSIKFHDPHRAAGCYLKVFSIRPGVRLEEIGPIKEYHFAVELTVGHTNVDRHDGFALSDFRVMRDSNGGWLVTGGDALPKKTTGADELAWEVFARDKVLCTESELRERLKGMTQQEIINTLGMPDNQLNEIMAGQLATIYVYQQKDLAYEPATRRVPDNVSVIIARERGVVFLVEFSSYSSKRYDPERHVILVPGKK